MHEAGMTDGSRLALVAAFYLSKHDAAALTGLGYLFAPRRTDNLSVRISWQVSAKQLLLEEHAHE